MFGFSGVDIGVYQLMLFAALTFAATEEATGSVTGFAPSQVTAHAGQPVVLNCTIDGNVSPHQIRWKHNDRIVLVGTCNYKLQWFSDGKTSQLTIPSASPADNGTYECGIYIQLVRRNASKRYNWYRFGNRVLVHVIGEQLELTDTDCYAVGENTVNVLWKPATVFKSLTQYSVYFCKDPQIRLKDRTTPEKDYTYGCSEIAHQEEESKINGQFRQCNIGEPLDLHFAEGEQSFHYYIKANNSNRIYWSKKTQCSLTMKFRCTKAQNLIVESTGSRNLTLHWSEPPFMGGTAYLLCYNIVYNAEGDLKNMTRGPFCPLSEIRSASFHNLKPYTRYAFYIQCSIETSSRESWGELAGPAENITGEEAPSEAPEFIVSNSIEEKYGDLRNVTVAWKTPPKRTWNGVPSHFIINVWKWRAESSNKTKPPSKQVVIPDGTATRGVICGLERFSDYRCTIRMCTKAGCGPSSGIKRVFPEIAGGRSPPDASTKSSSLISPWWQIILIVIAVAVILVLTAAAAFKAYRRRRRGVSEPSLDNLTLRSLSNNSSTRANQENEEPCDEYAQISDLTAESTDPEQQPLADEPEQVRFAPV